MSQLKTINISGHAYFVTSKIIGGLNIFFIDKFCQVIIDNLNYYRKSKNFKLLGYVIMLDHIHLIIWPVGKYNISDIMMNFKEFTAKQIVNYLKQISSNSREALAPRPELVGKMFRQAGLGTYHSLGEESIPQLTGDSSARRGRLAFSGRGFRASQVSRSGLKSRGARLSLSTSPTQLLAYFKEQAKNIKGQNYKIWLSRSWIENIYSDKFLDQKLEYIHQNPVRAGFVKDPVDWKYSSARNYYLNNHSLIKIDLI